MCSLSPLPALKYHAQVPSAAIVFFFREHILILQQIHSDAAVGLDTWSIVIVLFVRLHTGCFS